MEGKETATYSLKDIRPLISKTLGKPATTDLNLSNYFRHAFVDLVAKIADGEYTEITAIRKLEISKMLSPQNYCLALNVEGKIELMELAEEYTDLKGGEEECIYSYLLLSCGKKNHINFLMEIVQNHFEDYISNLIQKELNAEKL